MMTMTARSVRSCAPLVVLMAVAVSPSATAQEMAVDSVLRDFIPSGEYALLLDGEPVEDAEIYFSQRAGSAVLLRSSRLPGPTLVEPRGRQVRTVAEGGLKERSSGAVDVLADATLTSVGSFEVDVDGDVTFTIDGRSVRLTDKPNILGLHGTDDLLDYSAGYAYGARQYDPSGPMVRALRRVEEPARVRVYFGYWCPHCRDVVPRMLKVAQELEGSPIEFEYYGLPENFVNDRAARQNDITGVPTAIVYRDGEEIGRIEGNEWNIPELALRKLLM